MKIAFIHSEKKITTGAHYINDLIATKLKEKKIKVKDFYPKAPLMDSPRHLKGLKNILFFYSLLENKDDILKCDLIQGTTYTPLTFIPFNIPIISHFGSTTIGFLKSTPLTHQLEKETRNIYYRLKKEKVLDEINIRTRRPLRDIWEIEKYVASKADAVIATSQKVKQELMENGIPENNIEIIHNAIEDYWYDNPSKEICEKPKLVFIGRLGGDAFNLKLKGFDRLIHLYNQNKDIPKVTIAITNSKKLVQWLTEKIPNHELYANIKKHKIPDILRPLKASIVFIPSRYEGFSLSLIEAMSQGLIPVIYPVGVAPEIIENGVNGYIVENQNDAQKIISELFKDPKKRAELSENAYKTSLKFKSDSMIEKLIALYEKVLKEKTENKNIINNN
ncbi:glycosyltransferase family 4 protein [Candidatus Falkowbacteria bacterium]|nr:glycosyltransferase family 4 protein [Candidatus Falkowbacteria bacterium]